MNVPDGLTPPDLPPLVWLRAFEAAARLSSFTAAARELNLTQAAVSYQVRSLEKHLGVTLFERLSRSLRLTEIGAAYLPPLRRSFDELAAATAGLFGTSGRRALVIRAPASFATFWLAPRLPSFQKAHPDIALRISSIVWPRSAIEEGTDIEIRFGDGKWPDTWSERIAHCGAVVVCHPGSVPQGSELQRAMTLSRAPLIHISGYEDFWQRIFAPHKIMTPPYHGLNVDTSMAALELAASGYGPTIALEHFARPYLATGRLALALETRLPIEQSHYVLLVEGARRQRPETILFRDWLKAQTSLDTIGPGPTNSGETA